MEEKRSSCPACGELDECNLEIPYALLSQSIQNGCKLCDILRQGVSGFIDGELDTIDSLILSVDITLLVTVTGKTLKNPPVVEFYTLPGQLTPLRLRMKAYLIVLPRFAIGMVQDRTGQTRLDKLV